MIPKFLQIPTYSLDISDLSYKFIKFSEKKDGIIIDDFGEGEIASGVIVEGEIKKRDVLVSLLKELFTKKKIKYIALALPEEKGFLSSVRLPKIEKKEIINTLELQLEEHIPIPPSEVAFDYSIIAEEKDHTDVVIQAFPKAFIESYAGSIFSAGGIPVIIESELHASLRAAIPFDFTRLGMFIDFGKTKIGFGFFENRILQFMSSAKIGGEAIDEAISKNLNVNLKDAFKLKQEKGFLQSKDSLAVFQAIIPIITAIREEAEKYLSYWQTHSQKKVLPSKIFLSGGDSNLKGLKEYFEREIGIETSLVNPWINVEFPMYYLPKIEFKDSIRYTAAAGLALRALKESKEL